MEGPLIPDFTVALFRCLHDFAKLFVQRQPHHLLPSSRQRIRNGKLSLAGMLSIIVLFHILADKDFSHSGTMASHKSTGPVLVHSPVRAGL